MYTTTVIRITLPSITLFIVISVMKIVKYDKHCQYLLKEENDNGIDS